MRNDGGPAFPSIGPNAAGTWFSSFPGLSVRDWFAAAALNAWCRTLIVNGEHMPPMDRDLARWAYQTADAMLAERDKS